MSTVPSARRHVGSTYRLQLNGVGFAAATALVPFLAELGVETCYVSPITRAKSGSTHGYDVVDPTELDPALGEPEEFESLLAALDGYGMRLLVDIVPNHMATSTENPFFVETLRAGREAATARFFDIAWDEQDGRILLPVLGRGLDEILEAGELKLAVGADGAVTALTYFDNEFPVAAGTEPGPIADVLAAQHYRLADWRLANQQVNYRRFFDINELIGVRQEDPDVFATTHRLVAGLAADPRVAGFRVDHVDGLRDPAGYLSRLRDVTSADPAEPAPWIVVEKILAGSETLPDWPVEGTTGYEIANLLVGLFVDAEGAAATERATRIATGDPRPFGVRALDDKRTAVDTLFPHQLEQVVTHIVDALSAVTSAAPSVADVRLALAELTAQLAVYRTYRGPGPQVRPEDLGWLEQAASAARESLEPPAQAALDTWVAMVSGAVIAAPAGELDPTSAAVLSWQQLTGPVAAKGVEDTASYDSGGLLAAADVGAEPDEFARSVEDAHDALAARAHQHPLAMSATSTHDSKRSHDLRCRIAVLSERAQEWEATVAELDEIVVAELDEDRPDPADRRALYQTLVGAWPLEPCRGAVAEDFLGRMREHTTKVAREAKRHSGWADPDTGYEDAFARLAELVITGQQERARVLIESTVEEIEWAAASNALASVVVKTMAPGVPDTYQGEDAWFFAMVDPDNRRPLDADFHRGLADSLPSWPPVPGDHARIAGLLADWRSGGVKQLVLRNALRLRRAERDLFAAGRYVPLSVHGDHAGHLFAFAREHEGRWVIAAVPRLVQRLAGAGRFATGRDVWGELRVELPAGAPDNWVSTLTGQAVRGNGELAVAGVLGVLPVAILQGS